MKRAIESLVSVERVQQLRETTITVRVGDVSAETMRCLTVDAMRGAQLVIHTPPLR